MTQTSRPTIDLAQHLPRDAAGLDEAEPSRTRDDCIDHLTGLATETGRVVGRDTTRPAPFARGAVHERPHGTATVDAVRASFEGVSAR